MTSPYGKAILQSSITGWITLALHELNSRLDLLEAAMQRNKEHAEYLEEWGYWQEKKTMLLELQNKLTHETA